MDLIKVQTHALLVAQFRRAARHCQDGTSHGHELPVGVDPGAGDEHRLRQAVKQPSARRSGKRRRLAYPSGKQVKRSGLCWQNPRHTHMIIDTTKMY